MLTNKKREGINTFVCAIPLSVAETPKSSIKDKEPPLPIIPFGIVAYGFVGQPFSKQLYTDELKMALRARKVSGLLRNGPMNRKTTNLMFHTQKEHK